MDICGIICNCGPNGEPLACGYLLDHEGNHSWATIPTFQHWIASLPHEDMPGHYWLTTGQGLFQLVHWYNGEVHSGFSKPIDMTDTPTIWHYGPLEPPMFNAEQSA